MTTQAPAWYREKIRDMVRARYQSNGGYLDGTMTRGDGHAGLIKFPVIGRVEAYELSGSIQKIQNTNPDLSMVEVRVRDFEASAWMRVQDARRQGPNEQAAVGKMLTAAIRRKKDNLKLEALDLFARTNGEVKTIGNGAAALDVLDFLEAHAQIRGAGAEEDVWAPITEAAFDQLLMYKEFAKSEYIGPSDLPFAKAASVRKKTWRGIHFLTLPDEHFTYGTGAFGTGTAGNGFDTNGYIDTFMWATDAVGNEAEWDQETPSITSHADYEGTPMLAKVGLSGNSVGILPEGVKRIRFKANTRAVRQAA